MNLIKDDFSVLSLGRTSAKTRHQVALKGLLWVQRMRCRCTSKRIPALGILCQSGHLKCTEIKTSKTTRDAIYSTAHLRAHWHISRKGQITHPHARSQEKARKKLLSMVEGIFTPLPNPIMFQFRQMELYARFSARCCSNKDINSLDGKFERQ